MYVNSGNKQEINHVFGVVLFTHLYVKHTTDNKNVLAGAKFIKEQSEYQFSKQGAVGIWYAINQELVQLEYWPAGLGGHRSCRTAVHRMSGV